MANFGFNVSGLARNVLAAVKTQPGVPEPIIKMLEDKVKAHGDTHDFSVAVSGGDIGLGFNLSVTCVLSDKPPVMEPAVARPVPEPAVDKDGNLKVNKT